MEKTFHLGKLSYSSVYKCTNCLKLQVIHVLVNHFGVFV